MFLEDVNILAESTATMKATLYSDAGYNTGVLATSSLGACNAGVLRGRSRCDRSSVPTHRFGRSLLSVGRQRKSDRVGGLAPPGAALCWRTTGSLPVAEVPCTTTMRMEIAGVPGVFGFYFAGRGHLRERTLQCSRGDVGFECLLQQGQSPWEYLAVVLRGCPDVQSAWVVLIWADSVYFIWTATGE